METRMKFAMVALAAVLMLLLVLAIVAVDCLVWMSSSYRHRLGIFSRD